MTADDIPHALDALPAAWRAVLPGWTPQAFADVAARVKKVSGDRPIAPPRPLRALELVPPEAVKVVVFGQDPYPTAGHADGLAFSAGHGRPTSLRRIFEVLAADRPGFIPPAVWKLDGWARQGVLLLNPVLTVEIGKPGSHMHCGWQALTAQIVQALCEGDTPPTFLLWGKPAQAFFDSAMPPFVAPRVLRTRHPSYDFKGEFMANDGGSHFAQTADQIDWWSL